MKKMHLIFSKNLVDDDESEESDNKSNDFQSTDNEQITQSVVETLQIRSSQKKVEEQLHRNSEVSQNLKSLIETDAAGWR